MRLIVARCDAIAVSRDRDRRVVLDFWARGTLPQDMELTMRGFKRAPRLQPFPDRAPVGPGYRLVG
jgi:hypothetical protein